jgi:hypothetical protein
VAGEDGAGAAGVGAAVGVTAVLAGAGVAMVGDLLLLLAALRLALLWAPPSQQTAITAPAGVRLLAPMAAGTGPGCAD